MILMERKSNRALNQSSSQSSPTIDAAYKKKIDGAIISLMNDVKQYIEAPGTFEDFTGAGNE